MNSVIKLSNISKSFFTSKKINVLKKINYNFKKGKIYSLMGPSGSGKSTLLNLLSLIDRPSSGFLSFENKKIDFNDSTQNDLLRANKIGIIYQQDNLLPDFTSLENIYLAGLAAGQNKASSILKAKALLKKVGLINRLNHYPSELSGGEKQRVSIARAVINEPEIILADEPTGSLDEENTKKVMQIIFSIVNKLDTALVLATHNLDLIKKFDRCYKVDDGLIKEFRG